MVWGYRKSGPRGCSVLKKPCGNVEKVALELIEQAVVYLSDDVKVALRSAYCEETSPIGKTQLKTILENIKLAEKHQAPLCQDTGTLTFYVKAGGQAKDLDTVEEALINAAQRATIRIPQIGRAHV